MTATSTNTLYEDFILPHVEQSRRRGRLDDGTHSASRRIPACGDEVQLQLRFSDDQLADVRFEAVGCIISQAAASILCEHVEEQTIPELRKLGPEFMLALMRIPLTPRRRQCALLPWFALQDILNQMNP